MRNQRLKKCWIIAFVITLVSFVALFFSHKIEYGEMIVENTNTDIYAVLNEQIIDIKENHTIEERISGISNLYSFSLKLNSEEITDEEIIYINLKDSKGNIVQSWEEHGIDIGFDGYKEYVIDKHISESLGSDCIIEIKGNAGENVIAASYSECFDEGKLYIDDKVQDGDLAIKIFVNEIVYQTLFFTLFICLLLGLLIGFVCYHWEKILLALNNVKKNVKDNKRQIGELFVYSIAIFVVSMFIELGISKFYCIPRGIMGLFNEFRFLFLFVTLETICLCLKYQKLIKDEPEKLFLIIFLLIGTLYVVVMPGEAEVSWDESIHYWRSVVVSHMLDGKANYAESWLYWHSGIGYTLPNSISALRVGQDNIQAIYDFQNILGCSNIGFLTRAMALAYIPCGFMIAVGRVIGLPYVVSFHLGTFINMLMYVVLFYIGIKRLKYGKMVLIAVAGIPTSFFLSSVYSYDSWITAFTALGFAYFVGCMQDERITKQEIIVILASFTLAFIPKPVYFPLLLIILMIPKAYFPGIRLYIRYVAYVLALLCTYIVAMLYDKWHIFVLLIILYMLFYRVLILLGKLSRRQRNIFLCSVFFAAVCIVIVAIFKVLPSLLGTGDLRGGEGVNAAEQVFYILKNPVEYTKILLGFIFKRYLNPGVELQGIFNTFGYIGKSNLHVLGMVFIAFVSLTDQINVNKWRNTNYLRWSSLGWGFVTICLIATALYVDFTPVGNNTVLGCQIRYIIPVLIPVLLSLGIKRIVLPVTKLRYNQFVIMGTTGLLLLNLWTIVIQNYS